MKKIIISISIILMAGMTAYAQNNQVLVKNEGILIGNDVATSTSNITLNNKSSRPIAVHINNLTTITSGWNYGAGINTLTGKDKDVALRISAYHTTPQSRARAYGIYTAAGNATSGYNYGIYSFLAGSNNGTALYASSQEVVSDVISGGRFSGWFMGRVYMSERLGIGTNSPSCALEVNGTISCTALTQTSDLRAKTNVADLGSTLNKLEELRPVKYNLLPDNVQLRAETLQALPDTGKVVTADMRKYLALEEKRDQDRKHIGFIAQEFKKVFPELVYEDDKGMLSIDYLSLIPVLVETIQELNRRLEAMENKQTPGIIRANP